MSIAAGILLIAIGAVLRYAVNESFDDIDLETIGLILMIAGAAGLLLEFLRQSMGRDRRTERIVERPGEPAEREEIRERR
jgi:hypothetical protein